MFIDLYFPRALKEKITELIKRLQSKYKMILLCNISNKHHCKRSHLHRQEMLQRFKVTFTKKSWRML
jgi:hypothetical protein